LNLASRVGSPTDRPAEEMVVEHPNRIAGLTAYEMSDEARRLLDVTVSRVAGDEAGGGGPKRTKPLHILTVMAHHPTFLAPFIEWATAIAQRGLLTRRAHEILALRVAANCRSEFEWGHHVVYARAAGLSEDDIDRLVAGPDAPGWSDTEGALVRAADELTSAAFDISGPTWEVLRSHYDDATLTEIPFVVGQYTMLSMFANGLGVVLEPEYEHLPVDGRRQR
jgi:4-carboxymuconolactone decarboxylase